MKKRMKEKCVVCWNTTEFFDDVRIEFRDGYIEGVGQLCRACYAQLYGARKNEREN